MYQIIYTKQAIKDIPKLKSNNLAQKALALIEILKKNPHQSPPPYEKLVGDFQNLYSRRINMKHRLVYQIDNENNEVKIISMWSHYETI